MRAFWRSAPGVRFINFEIFATGNLSCEYFRSSAMLALVQGFTRRLVLLAIRLSNYYNTGYRTFP
jgi:hypothetical protein